MSWTCPHCNARIADDNRNFCTQCGQPKQAGYASRKPAAAPGAQDGAAEPARGPSERKGDLRIGEDPYGSKADEPAPKKKSKLPLALLAAACVIGAVLLGTQLLNPAGTQPQPQQQPSAAANTIDPTKESAWVGTNGEGATLYFASFGDDEKYPHAIAALCDGSGHLMDSYVGRWYGFASQDENYKVSSGGENKIFVTDEQDKALFVVDSRFKDESAGSTMFWTHSQYGEFTLKPSTVQEVVNRAEAAGVDVEARRAIKERDQIEAWTGDELIWAGTNSNGELGALWMSPSLQRQACLYGYDSQGKLTDKHKGTIYIEPYEHDGGLLTYLIIDYDRAGYSWANFKVVQETNNREYYMTYTILPAYTGTDNESAHKIEMTPCTYDYEKQLYTPIYTTSTTSTSSSTTTGGSKSTSATAA